MGTKVELEFDFGCDDCIDFSAFAVIMRYKFHCFLVSNESLIHLLLNLNIIFFIRSWSMTQYYSKRCMLMVLI